jgi:hypothetical protein
VTLVYAPPQGNSTRRTVTTGNGGSYADNGYVPDQTGTVHVTASWAGNDTYDGSSATCNVPVS